MREKEESAEDPVITNLKYPKYRAICGDVWGMRPDQQATSSAKDTDNPPPSKKN